MIDLSYETILKAMYFNYKREIAILYLNNNSFCSKSYLYAVIHDMYPFFNEAKEIDLYENYYDISKDFIKKVVRHIDDLFEQEKYPTFYDLQWKFGRENKDKIYHILRYCYLDDRFSVKLWEKIKSDCPIEFKSFDKVFDIDSDIRMVY